MDPDTLHRESIVFDGHCDSLLRVLEGKLRLGELNTDGHLDLPRLRQAGVTALVFAVFLEDCFLPAGAARQTLRALDALFGALAENPNALMLATKSQDVELAKSTGKVAAIIGFEGAEALEGDLGLLRVFHRLGLRLLTVTWSRRNQAGDGIWEARTGGGLTNFGTQLIEACNQLGIVVDISHLSPPGVKDVLTISAAPVVASHSNAFSICPNRRNLTDEQLAGLAACGGVVGVTFVPSFISEKEDEASLETLLDHIDHIARVAGVEHVGIGSDFDGFGPSAPKGLEDVTCLPEITAGLVRRGYATEDVRKILGGNFLRVFRQVAG